MPVSNCPFRLLIVFYHTDTELEKMGIGWDRRGDSTDSRIVYCSADSTGLGVCGMGCMYSMYTAQSNTILYTYTYVVRYYYLSPLYKKT